MFEQKGVPRRHIHRQGDLQWAYNDWLASMCGTDVPKTPSWRIQLWKDARALKNKYSPDVYRDKWDNEQSLDAAHSAFRSLLDHACV
jgi:ABC-type Fe3+-citrate transport system substrate-binding protein